MRQIRHAAPSDSVEFLLNAGHPIRRGLLDDQICAFGGRRARARFHTGFRGILGGHNDQSSGHKDQARGEQEIPVCSHRIGTLAIVPPDKEWWRELNLGSPEAIIKIFVQQSGCFTMVNRDRAMNSRAMERALADKGELQRGSNMGKGQVKAADYFLQPDIVSTNKNSGGGGAGAAVGGLLGHFGGWGGAVGALAGSINVKKGEANVTLDLVNARTTEEEALTEGYARKTDISWGAGGGCRPGGAASRRRARRAIRTPRSARSSSSPISTPTRSWSPSSAAIRQFRRQCRRTAELQRPLNERRRCESPPLRILSS